MRRYYFNTADGRSFNDQEGVMLASDDEARLEAARLLGQMVKEHPGDIWRDNELQISVTGEDGMTLFMLDLAAFESPVLGANARPLGEEHR